MDVLNDKYCWEVFGQTVEGQQKALQRCLLLVCGRELISVLWQPGGNHRQQARKRNTGRTKLFECFLRRSSAQVRAKQVCNRPIVHCPIELESSALPHSRFAADCHRTSVCGD